MPGDLKQQPVSVTSSEVSRSESLARGWTRTGAAAYVRGFSEGVIFAFIVYAVVTASYVLLPVIAVAVVLGMLASVLPTLPFDLGRWLHLSVIVSGVLVFYLCMTVVTLQETAEPSTAILVAIVGGLLGIIGTLTYELAVSGHRKQQRDFKKLVEQQLDDQSKTLKMLERDNIRLGMAIKSILRWLPLVFKARSASDLWANAIAIIERDLDRVETYYPDPTVRLVRARFFYEIGRSKDAEDEVEGLLHEIGLDERLEQEAEQLLDEIVKFRPTWVHWFSAKMVHSHG